MKTMKISLLAGMSLAILAVHSRAVSQVRRVESIKDSSSITYILNHPLHTIEAVSREGSFRADVDTAARQIQSVTAQADVMSFDSGNSNRDSHAMEVIDAISYPDVVFSSTHISPIGDSLLVTGILDFHGMADSITATMHPKWTPGELDVAGGFNLSLTAFKIDRPSLLMIPVSDTLRFELRAVFDLR